MKPLLRTLGNLEFLRFGVRDRIIRTFCHPDRTAAEEFEVGFYGLRYAGNLDSFLDWSVYFYGAYERQELKLIADLAATMHEPVVLDIGANVGHHSLFLSTIASVVHAFEPFEEVARIAEERVRRNGISNVVLHRTGLGDRTGDFCYDVPTGANRGTGSFDPDGKEDGLRLPLRIGDEYLEEIGVPRVDFMKIDVEGAEIMALRGLEKTLRSSRPLCFFEWTPSCHGTAEVQGRALFPDDYRFYLFRPEVALAGLFATGDYHLRPLDREWPGGNILAVPREKAEIPRALSHAVVR